MQLLKKFSNLFGSIVVVLALLFAPALLVQGAGNAGTLNGSGNSGTLDASGNSGTLTSPTNSGTYQASENYLQNPIGSKASSICQLVNLLLKAVMIIGVPIAVLFIVYAGFKFVMSRGSPGEITEARANLLNVIIGIAIFLGASLIAEVIFNTLKQLGVSGLGAC